MLRTWCGSDCISSWVHVFTLLVCRQILLHKKAVSHVINSRALTAEKPCINKAIHALLMHGYATFNMTVPGHRFAAVRRCVLPGPRTSIVHGNCVRETSVKRQNKLVQEITRNVANVFSFLCNNIDRTWFFNALPFARPLGRCWKPRPSASVFNPFHGTWRMFMHEKPCLIPILFPFGLGVYSFSEGYKCVKYYFLLK